MRHYACLPEISVTEGGFYLTTVQDDHIESIRQWRNAQIDMLRQAEPITPDQQVRYYTQQIWPSLEDARPKNILLSFLEDQRLIGYGGLVHIAWEHRRAELSFLLDTALTADFSQYTRYFSIYLMLLKRLAFESLTFHRLCTETYAIRSGVIGLLEQNGFQLEGRLREHVFIDGKPVDALMHGCLRDRN